MLARLLGALVLQLRACEQPQMCLLSAFLHPFVLHKSKRCCSQRFHARHLGALVLQLQARKHMLARLLGALVLQLRAC